jgi:hypothetical protein
MSVPTRIAGKKRLKNKLWKEEPELISLSAFCFEI